MLKQQLIEKSVYELKIGDVIVNNFDENYEYDIVISIFEAANPDFLKYFIIVCFCQFEDYYELTDLLNVIKKKYLF